MAESFFATLKTEFYYRRVWPTKAGASREVGAWSRTATTGAAGTPRSGRSAPSRSRCNTPTRPRQNLKPHNPVSTVRGQGQSTCMLCRALRARRRLMREKTGRAAEARAGAFLVASPRHSGQHESR